MSDYQEAVQNPASCFSDPDLRKGTPTLNALGLPQPVTGGFCSVYQGMYVPPLRGRGSHEKGHPAYQHPEREGKDFDESVDRFSALVIQASLLALAEKPDLWKKYNEEDNLIFRRADFQSPDSAPVFKDLDKMGGSV